jgi:hypothetical protein
MKHVLVLAVCCFDTISCTPIESLNSTSSAFHNFRNRLTAFQVTFMYIVLNLCTHVTWWPALLLYYSRFPLRNDTPEH